MTVETMFPDIYENFNKGFFTFQKSENQFSQMALDQVHEQNNCTIKSCGGATDLVNKVEESALIRWGTCGSEVPRIINEFEESMKLETPEEDDSNLHLHHEDSATYKKKISSDVKTLRKSMTINPFSQTKLTKFQNAGKSAIIIEMSPLILAKCFQKAGMTCFLDLAIVLYYEILRLGFDYN